MIRTAFRALLIMASAVLTMLAAGCGGTSGPARVQFQRYVLSGKGFHLQGPLVLALSPDGRLYVAESSGRIQAATMDPKSHLVTAVEQIASADAFPIVLGLAFGPTDGKLYVSSTVIYPDVTKPLVYFPGKITRVDAPGVFTDIITGLPGSNVEHGTNGIAFSPDGRLFIAQGDPTNAGVNSEGFTFPPSPLSGAILVADIFAPGFDGHIRYSDAIPSPTTTQAGGDVSVYAAGLRNPFDLVWHSNGKLYATDNGANEGSGPASTDCQTSGDEPKNPPDELDLVIQGDYYGHANRNRGRSDARQCTYWPGNAHAPGDVHQPIALLKASSDGIAEYPINASPGARRGDLFYANWLLGTVRRIRLKPDGEHVESDAPVLEHVNGALDIVAAPDGTLYITADHDDQIIFLRPR